MLTLRTHDIMIFEGMNGKLIQKIPSGNEYRARKEKMMNWVFQTLAKDRDWTIETLELGVKYVES